MKFKKTTLKDGLRVVTIPMADNPSVTVLVMVEAGSKYESKKDNGLSHFLEHMVFKGTTKRPKAIDISRELDSIGANYNAFTGWEFTGYYAKADSRHLDKVIDIVSDMYLDPLFDEKEMEKEKGVIVEEIRMYQDLPQSRAQDLFMSLVYGDQPAGWNIAGTEDNVRSFTRKQLVAYRDAHYVKGSTIVFVAGSFDEEKVLKTIEETFSNASLANKKGKEPVKDEQDAPRAAVEFKETDQTHLVLGVRTFDVFDPRIPTAIVLSTILGKGMSSRLFVKMRDELGICYYIKTDHNPFTDHGLFTISAGLDNSRVDEGLKNIIAECKKIRDEKISPEELKKAKDYISGTTMLDLETSESRAEYCGYQETMKGRIDSPEEILAKINNVTAEDIQGLAKEIFVDKGLNLALVGRYKDAEIFKKHLKFE